MKVLFQLLFGAGLLHSLLRLLFLSGALYFLLRSAVTIVRTRQLGKKSGETDQSKNGTELGTETQIESHGRDSGNKRIASVVAVLFLGFAGGWSLRNSSLASNRVTYTDVFVADKISQNRFLMQPARMQPIESDLCYSDVDWEKGETLRDWTFEQLHGCKRVISYHRYLKGDLHARF